MPTQKVTTIIIFLSVALSNSASSLSVSKAKSLENDIEKFSIQMIGYSPQKTDDYVAVAREAIPGYIVGFEPMANADRVHHMLVYGCTVPFEDSTFWRGMGTCGYGGGSYILYAWARNAPNLVLPKNVAFSVGHEMDGIKYFVLQVHYAQPFDGEVHDFSGVTLHISQQKPTNLAAVMLFVSGTPIPPRQPQFQNNVTCIYESTTPIHPFAFRTHTHAMGRVVSAYFKHQNQWTKIGRRNPQWPQLFELIPNRLTISNGDQMSASCRFDSSDKNVTVQMGAMGVDEMCNFYMMFYWDSKQQNPYPQGAICGQNDPQLMKDYPKEGFELLPARPELEHHAHQSKIPFGVIEEARYTELNGIKFGQVAGLSFNKKNQLFVFHRVDRVWDQNTFDNYNILIDKTPINNHVILIISYNGNQSKIIEKAGKGLFYLPHGIYIDNDESIYTTDVGAHTVSKWRLQNGRLINVWQSGEKLMPGSDQNHYCKPTGITRVDDLLYITDGYCNSRIVVLDLNGKRIREFGLPGNDLGQFNVPHDISTDSAGKLIVTDRENGRVQRMTTQGHVIEQFKSTMFTNIYSASSFQDYIFMVPGRPTFGHEAEGISVFVGRLGTGLIEYAFGPKIRGRREQMKTQFGQPHSLRISNDGLTVFIGDIAEGKPTLWQFKIQHEESMSSRRSESTIFWPNIPKNDPKFNSMLILGAIAIFVIGAYYTRRRLLNHQNGGTSFNKKGFRPLQTEETVGFISDGSDSD